MTNQTTFKPRKDIPDLSGKVILVTGGNAGIGKATIRALAPHNPARIYLCARRRSAAETTAAEISAECDFDNICILDLDLASLDSVRQCAAEFNGKEDRLDMLFLNAGVATTPPELTKEGYELQFGVNHVGHALLTQLLMPTLLRTQKTVPNSDVRIIATSSLIAFSWFVPKGGRTLDAMRQPDAYGPMRLYANSKLANVHFTRKLSQLYPSITSTAAHPGTVMSDIWGKSAGGLTSIIFALFKPLILATAVDIDEGARSQLWCATAPLNGSNGVKNGQFYQPVGKINVPTGFGADQEVADELWDWTNKELRRHGGSEWPRHE